MNKRLILALGTLWACFACNLDESPKGVLSSDRPFTSVGEMKNYINQFYETGLKHQGFNAGGGNYIAGADTHSDNMASSAVDTRLNGQLALSQAQHLGAYTQIRNVNFLLKNLDNAAEKGSNEYNHMVGEAYFFRAWYYYRMFINYGELTYLDMPLDANQQEMLRKRDSRTFVADKILADLDKAIELLKEQSNSASMRIHRDVARALKSEVALFEGTWEKYHKAKGTPFYDKTITDAKIQDYLKQAEMAAKAVIDRGVWRIYSTGKTTEDYRTLFLTTDLTGNPEVLWFKRYDGDQVGNDVNRYLNEGGGSVGVTASLVDDYLTHDGRPFVGVARLNAKRNFGDELKPTLRDARLCQTIVPPGQRLRRDRGAYTLPPLKGSSAYNQNMTGYSLLKYVQTDYMGNLDAEGKGATCHSVSLC